MTDYAELQVTTNFSFLRGASHPQELVERAYELGLRALGITDRNTLAGVVRAHVAAKTAGLRLIIGARLDLVDGHSLLCYPTDRNAYGRLSRLLSTGQRRAPKGQCFLSLDDVGAAADGQIFIVVPPDGLPGTAFRAWLARVREALSAPLYLAAQMLYTGADRQRLRALDTLARTHQMPLVATNDVLYHSSDRRPLQDVISCIRNGCTVQDAGRQLNANAERHLKAPQEMARIFRGFGDAVERSMDIVEACHFSLDDLRYDYPDEPIPRGQSPHQYLCHLTWAGAETQYPDGIPSPIRATLNRELALIKDLNYAPYFLTVYDIVAFARAKGILCQGRGSAANSAVCYCLGITAVDPNEVSLLFERFISSERNEPPDIDVDFEHDRREEVIQYIYGRYGRERAGLAATVICYRARSAIREVGKALGLTPDVTAALAGTVWGWSQAGIPDNRIREAGLDASDARLHLAVDLATQLAGFPRHLSQHVGGFVLTRSPLCEVVPIGNAAMDERTFVEWDKDDLDALKILKIDVLGLGMLTCIRKCFDLIADHYGRPYSLTTIPQDDKAVYDMLGRADSLGVFQVESRAQMNMLPRLKPQNFYDLVIEVAIVRPGPIQGDMVHPYLRRRNGQEPVSYPSPSAECGPKTELEAILHKTMGVPLFQEQAMRIAIEAAKFTPEEANQLRHAMATFRRRGTIDRLRDKFITGMTERGYEKDFAERCFKQIKGFGEYGFPESHSASFAKLVYISSWLKCHYPDAFACALLNAQPMGFYAPSQIVRDAQNHGVDIRDPDINLSDWDSGLEPCQGRYHAVRLGLRHVDGLSEADAARILSCRYQTYPDLEDAHGRSGLPVSTFETLAAADACRSMGLDRRDALWAVRTLTDSAPLPLFVYADLKEADIDDDIHLPAMPLQEHVVADYQTLHLSLKAHPMRFFRSDLDRKGVLSTTALHEQPHNARISVAGVVLVRQRPGSAKGVVFLTIEDEHGIANCVIWPDTMERYRAALMGGRMVFIRGRIQKHDTIVHVMVEHMEDWSFCLDGLADGDTKVAIPLCRADEVTRPGDDPYTPHTPPRHPRNMRIIPKSRDFH